MIVGGTVGNNIEYTELYKTIRKKMREDLRIYNTRMMQKAVERNKGLKEAIKNQTKHRLLIPAFKKADGTVTRNRDEISDSCAKF